MAKNIDESLVGPALFVGVMLMIASLALGVGLGRCEMRRDVVGNGCAEWTVDEAGKATIDWCAGCPGVASNGNAERP